MNDGLYHPICPDVGPITIGGKEYHNVSRKKNKHLKSRGWPDGDDVIRAQQLKAETKRKKRKKTPKGRSRYYKIIALIEKFGSKCFYCEIEINKRTATIDHKVPKSKGGGNSIGNLLLSCWSCNNDKGDMSYDEYMEKIGRNANRISY